MFDRFQMKNYFKTLSLFVSVIGFIFFFLILCGLTDLKFRYKDDVFLMSENRFLVTGICVFFLLSSLLGVKWIRCFFLEGKEKAEGVSSIR